MFLLVFSAPCLASTPNPHPENNSGSASIKANLILLDDAILEKLQHDPAPKLSQAKNEYFRKSDEEWIAGTGYYLGYKIPGFFTGKPPISFGVITPYSAANHVFYKAESNFMSVNPEVIGQLKQFKNIVYIVAFYLTPGEDTHGQLPTKVVNVTIKKGDLLYLSLPKQDIPQDL